MAKAGVGWGASVRRPCSRNSNPAPVSEGGDLPPIVAAIRSDGQNRRRASFYPGVFY